MMERVLSGITGYGLPERENKKILDLEREKKDDKTALHVGKGFSVLSISQRNDRIRKSWLPTPGTG